MLDSTGLELSPELLLSVPLDNLCPMGTTGMRVRALRLVPSCIASTPFGMIGTLELGWPELKYTRYANATGNAVPIRMAGVANGAW